MPVSVGSAWQPLFTLLLLLQLVAPKLVLSVQFTTPQQNSLATVAATVINSLCTPLLLTCSKPGRCTGQLMSHHTMIQRNQLNPNLLCHPVPLQDQLAVAAAAAVITTPSNTPPQPLF
jgi:hypothetical protein